MSIRKTNPERRPSLKKTVIPSIVQISPNYKQIIKNFETKHTQESVLKLITSISSFLTQWNQKPIQFQQAHPRQSLIKGLTQVSQQHDGLSIITKLKIVKSGLELVFKINLGPSLMSEDTDKNKNILIQFKGLLDVGVRISQDSKNDKSVSDSGIIKILFQLLASLYEAFAFKIQKAQKKIISQPQRKNSLKKNDNFPIIQRPKSRQKLSSLSKRDSKSSIAMLNSTSSTLKQQQVAETIEIQDIILSLLTLIKNCGANNDLKKKILQQQCLNLLNKYIQVWNDKNMSPIGNKILIQITSTHRHLAVQQKCFKIFMVTKTVMEWIRLLQVFPTHKDIMLNLLRLFSKLSTVEECCEVLDSRQLCIRNLISFFATYKTDIYIIIRVSFIFANMTAYLVDIRNKMYFKYSAFTDIYQCFDYYITSELKGKASDIDKMGISKMAWDYQAMKKQSDIQALVKIIRLIANILTINEIGMDIYVNKGIQFRDLIKKLKILLEKKPNIEDNPDLIICGLSCLANALFYDKEVVLSSVDHKNTKLQIIAMLPNFIVQAQNQQVCCEGLRVLSNLSRSKQFISNILINQLHQATLILLESSSKQIVYYSMGVLINLLVDQQFKAQNQQRIVRGVLDILKQCNNEDFDIITICSKCISNVAKGLTGSLVKQIEETMDNLGTRCDSLMIRPSSVKQQKQNLQQSRKMINMVINDLTADPFVCKVGDCGRRFGSQIELKAHVDRRHKL